MSHLLIRTAYQFALDNGLDKEVAEIRSIPDLPGYNYTTGVRRAHMIELLEQHGLMDEFFEKHWPDGKTPARKTLIERYRRRRIAYEELAENGEGRNEDEVDLDIEEDCSSFAYERDLQNFLARNLNLLEEGLQLYSDERGSGIEYPVDGGRIDLLAKAKDGRLVVVELKLSRGRSKAIGQLLYYMGWVDNNLKPEKPCRGILIAKDIGSDVITAVQRTEGVELFKYTLQVAVERV